MWARVDWTRVGRTEELQVLFGHEGVSEPDGVPALAIEILKREALAAPPDADKLELDGVADRAVKLHLEIGEPARAEDRASRVLAAA
jgi:hypothetical protein